MAHGQKRAVCYIRVSTPAQAKEGESLDYQRESIIQFVKFKAEYQDEVKIYSDEGLSGKTIDDRPGLKKLLDDAKQNPFDCLVVQRLSRLGRNARDLLNISDSLRKTGAVLITLKENIDLSNPYGEAMFSILSAVAQLERDIIEEQMYENKLVRWRRHEIFIGRVPLGYRWNKEKKQLEIVEDGKAIYQILVNMYLDDGYSFQTIALKLREQGIKSKFSDFKEATISRIFKNPIYCGRYLVNQYTFENGKRTKILRPESEQISFPAPAIIDKMRWDQIQERIAFNKTKSKRSNQTVTYWLRDVLVCGECGGRIKPRGNTNQRNDGTYPRRYACSWKLASSKRLQLEKKFARCVLPFLDADELEEEVLYQILSRLSLGGRIGGKKMEPKLLSIIDPNKYKAQIKELESIEVKLEDEIKIKRRAKERVYRLLEQADFDPNELTRKLRDFENEILELESSVERTKTAGDDLKKAEGNDLVLRDFLLNKPEFLGNLQEEVIRLAPEDKKTLIESVLEKWKIRVSLYAEDQRRWMVEPFNFNFKPELFQRLIGGKKILQLDKKGIHLVSRHRDVFDRPVEPPPRVVVQFKGNFHSNKCSPIRVKKNPRRSYWFFAVSEEFSTRIRLCHPQAPMTSDNGGN